MTPYNFEKINPFEAYIAINKFHVICWSKSYLGDKNDLNIRSYNLYRADHPNNVKGDGASANIRASLPVRCLSNAYLEECLILEISINNKKGLSCFTVSVS